jgi:hypothetical protein
MAASYDWQATPAAQESILTVWKIIVVRAKYRSTLTG